ncbi:MAG: lactate dehydrogenase [Nevskia sp.]|nr:lactate dehydrogenase [Nevskia sp.]
MCAARVVIAGKGFGTVRQYMDEMLPEVEFEAVELPVLRAGGVAADVLIPAMARIDGELMDGIEGLRLIQQWGAGLEGVDVAAATARRIAVANVPTGGSGNAESVAEWCVMAAVAVSRRLPLAERAVRSGKSWGSPMGRAMLGRTAGIVGMGGIGQALAQRLRPFGMRLLGLRRQADPELAQRLGMEWIAGPERLAELLHYSDYLFLCMPLTGDTRGLIDARALALLPPQACVINAGRGGLIDQDALLEALASGRLTGAGLDVFAQEPLDPASPLLQRPDVVATPHIAGVTDASYRGIAERVAANVHRLLAGGVLHDCVNAHAFGAG